MINEVYLQIDNLNKQYESHEKLKIYANLNVLMMGF